jgi:hypothetical protein
VRILGRYTCYRDPFARGLTQTENTGSVARIPVQTLASARKDDRSSKDSLKTVTMPPATDRSSVPDAPESRYRFAAKLSNEAVKCREYVASRQIDHNI